MNMSIEELKKLQSSIIEKNKKYNRISTIVTISLIIIILLVELSLHVELIFFLFSLLFNIIFLLIINTIIKSTYLNKEIQIFNSEYKKVFVQNTLAKVFDNLNYNPNKGLSESVISLTGSMSTGDRFTSNDYISGTYKNVKFEQSDIHIEEKHEEKDDEGHVHERWVTIFLGRWMVFDFNKRFKANIQVHSGNLPFRNSSKVKFEDEEFNKMFSVFTNNEHDAFYVLTPQMLEKLKKIQKSLNCGLIFCFQDSKLNIAINNYNDSFECNVFKEINEEEIENNIIKDIKLITDFINELNLDNNLFIQE